VDGLQAALAVHCDIGGCISHLIPGPEVVCPGSHANAIGKESGFAVQSEEARVEWASVVSHLAEHERAVADDSERRPALLEGSLEVSEEADVFSLVVVVVGPELKFAQVMCPNNFRVDR
jgi:hypothetical protein